MLGDEPVCLAQADAVIAAEAALLKGDKAGAHLFLHVGADAAQSVPMTRETDEATTKMTRGA